MEAKVSTSSALQVDAITTEESGFQAANELRARGVEFDAIVAASDLIAIGALRALQDAGVDVPRQVAVTGFDDIPAASVTSPPLTTVMQDTRRAGELLVETLLSQITGEAVANRVISTSWWSASPVINGDNSYFSENRMSPSRRSARRGFVRAVRGESPALSSIPRQ